MSGWAQQAILWQVYPLGFVGADVTGAIAQPDRHLLRGLIEWLDYAVELGCSGLLLGPIFTSATHGYDTINYTKIDPRLGTEADFDALVQACHQRGLKLVLDGVFNHVGSTYPAYLDVLKHADSSAYRDWFVADGDGYATFEGHPGLIKLNHQQPQVATYVTEVMTHWLGRGADGWRLDAAYSVPASFWAPIVATVHAEHPDAYIFGEMIHGDYAEYVQASGLDSVTQYELWKAIWSALNERNFYELSWALARHADFAQSFVPQTFIGNHDVTRIASKLSDRQLLPHALVVLVTVAGTPSIYAGDEQAFRGEKYDRAGGDDEIRPPFPATPAQLSDIGAETHRLHQELLGLRCRLPWLFKAAPIEVHTTNEQLVYRCEGAGGAIVVALNLADQPVTVPAPHTDAVLAGNAVLNGDEVQLQARGWAVLGSY
ncbi:MAG: alpha-amylase family glycosyl hydrolase [Antricoccus sp.]